MSIAQASLDNPLALIRRLPGTVQVLIVGTFVNRAGSFIYPFLSLVLSRELALPTGQVAGWMAAYGAGSLVSMMLGGVLTDTLGRRRTMLLSMFGSGTLALGMALAPDADAFVPLLLAFSLLSDLYRPASSALLGDLLSSVDRPVGYAALRMAANLGFFFGMGIGATRMTLRSSSAR
jgi:MFS family permease